MKDIRDSHPGAPRDEDPFADLVRAVEGSSLRRPEPAAPIYGGFEPVEVPQSQWDQFSYQPSAVAGGIRAGAPSIDASVRIEPLSAAEGREASSARLSAEADLQIEDALRGLSQPARPRDTIPAETQSFAPARRTDIDPEPRHTITLDDFDELIASELAAMQPGQAPVDDEDDETLGFDESDADRHPDAYDDYPVARRSRLRTPLMLLGGVATLVLVGVAGAMVYSGVPGVAGGSEPLLIKADAEPFKTAPADPGGRSIPNQNKAVYQRVAGGSAADAPTQQSLVTAMEEPMDIAVEEDAPIEDLPGVDVGEALPSEADGPQAGGTEVAEAAPAETATLQPRKVRTLTVRPDGTLVANEGPAAAGEPAMITASNTIAQAAVLDPVAGISPSLPFSADSPDLTTASTLPVPAEPEPEAAPAEEPEAIAAAPEPVAPAPQPAEQVASLQPASPPPAADGYFVQISSQPSQALAEQSMANLGRRYASVIDGRGLGIKSADIPGKGTYYRVRVAATSRNEANSLCESLKSAGGSCFVTR